MITKKYLLNNGIQIPALGFGTWKMDDDTARRAVREAIEVGYRHIDTARLYGNEVGVGLGIKDSHIARSEIFLTTKITDQVKTYEDALKAIDESLNNLQVEYVDLLLIHSPRPFDEMFHPTDKTYNEENIEVWKALEEAYYEGKAKSIGVSNFMVEDLDNIINHCTIKPMANQLLCNITHYPKQLMGECKKRGILVQAYSPNATGKLKGNKVLEDMAKKYNCTLPQLANRFDYQLDTVVLPKTTHREYMIQNLNIDFEISDKDMEKLKSIGQYTGWKGADSE